MLSLRSPAAALPLAALALLSGCFGNTTSPFPPGLEALEDNSAAPPAGTVADPYPEQLSLLRGDTGVYQWAHARGYVHQPIEVVYQAMQTPEVCLDRRKAARWSVRDLTPTEQLDCAACDNAFVLHNEVDDIITVVFDMTWRFGVIEGTSAGPEVVTARFKKSFGTTFITRMEGSMILTRVDATTTEVSMVEQIEAATGGGDDIESYLRDYYVDLLAASHGQPLPVL